VKFSRELTVGLSIVLAVVIFVLGVRFFEDLPLFRGTYTLHTAFDNANGLNKGNAVRVNGVRVGAVDAVELDPEANRVRIRFHIDRAIAVTEGSHATLGGIAALASIHMNIHPGPPSNERVEDGGFIPGLSGGGLLEMVTEKGPELAGQVDSVLTTANRTFEEAEILLHGVDGEVQQTLVAFRRAAVTLESTLRAEQASLHRTLANLEAFSSDMSEFSGTSSDTITVAVQSLNRSMRRLEIALERVEGSTDTLDEILAKINAGDGTMARLINDPSVYARLDSTLASMNRILVQFENDPEVYLKHLELIDIF
jgi:phospholipid/cholesterol/gamma-HCH transport system substrate-binding protein